MMFHCRFTSFRRLVFLCRIAYPFSDEAQPSTITSDDKLVRLSHTTLLDFALGCASQARTNTRQVICLAVAVVVAQRQVSDEHATPQKTSEPKPLKRPRQVPPRARSGHANGIGLPAAS